MKYVVVPAFRTGIVIPAFPAPELDLSPEASARRVADWNRRFPQDHPRMSGTQHSTDA